MNITLMSLLQSVTVQLEPLYPHLGEAQQTAWWLLSKITGKTEAQLISQKNIELTTQQQETLRDYIHQHVEQKMPLQYILGWVPFNNIKILVEQPILIPRPETEEWCNVLIQALKRTGLQEFTLLDLCTGTGCIALNIAYEFPQACVIATDINDHALILAKKNATYNAIKNISFIASDLYEKIPHTTFDLIVANPPYISLDEWQTLDPMVRDWEDKQALVAKENGLFCIKKIIQKAPLYLKKNNTINDACNGQLYIEIGYQQGPIVQQIMLENNFNSAIIWHDLEGHDRVLIGAL